MGRQPCCDKVGLKKGPWSAEEDKRLINFIHTNGHCCWRALPKLAGLLRCGKSCRLRWTNYLRPDLKRGLLSEYEEQLVIHLHAKLGNRYDKIDLVRKDGPLPLPIRIWSKIASHLPGRTDNEIKNHWNTHIKKKLKKMGIDPLTHNPISDPPVVVQQPSKDSPLSTSTSTTQHIEELSSSDSLFVNEVITPAPRPTSCTSSSSSSTSSSSGSLLVDFEDLEIPGFDWSCYDHHAPNTNADILMSNGTEEAGFLWDADELNNWDLPIGVDSMEINLLPQIFSHHAELDSNNDKHETCKL